MEITNSYTNYLLICEIGPISDFVRHSRKTKDYWAASFLFSYFMAEVAKRVKKMGAEVFLPYLDNNPMVTTGKGMIDAGSVPDRLYFLVNKGNRKDIENLLKDVINNIISEIAPKVEVAVKNKARKTISLNLNEIKEFFNFFYIIHKFEKDQPTNEEFYKGFIEAERKIKMRSSFRRFSHPTDTNPIKKWEKCSLCGDRKKVHSEPVEKDDGSFNPYKYEHFCSVCILKRYLWEALQDNIVEPRYHSTSDIAAAPILESMIAIKNILKNDKMNALLNKATIAYKNLNIEHSFKSEDHREHDGRIFFDTSLTCLKDFRNCFNKVADEIKKEDKDYKPLRWLNRPFYAIVYMDGDNMGNILKEESARFREYITTVSEKISEFSLKVNDVVRKYKGQLIFAGGEDVNFIIHPEWLLECIGELNQLYSDYFANNDLTKDKKGDFTLSAGAVVCYHKYPLSSAILGAGRMLKEHAKKYPNKNATAISLIKGHTETFSFTFSNKRISDLIELKESLLRSEISRTTPYRIKEEKEILNTLTDNKHKENYLYTIIAGTRGAEKTNDEIKMIVKPLMKFHEPKKDTMTDALLYARFLAGDK